MARGGEGIGIGAAEGVHPGADAQGALQPGEGLPRTPLGQQKIDGGQGIGDVIRILLQEGRERRFRLPVPALGREGQYEPVARRGGKLGTPIFEFCAEALFRFLGASSQHQSDPRPHQLVGQGKGIGLARIGRRLGSGVGDARFGHRVGKHEFRQAPGKAVHVGHVFEHARGSPGVHIGPHHGFDTQAIGFPLPRPAVAQLVLLGNGLGAGKGRQARIPPHGGHEGRAGEHGGQEG